MIRFLIVLSSILSFGCWAQRQQDDPTVFGMSTVEIIRSRGFLAQAFNFTTKEGYILNVVRANNPLVNQGRPGGLANKSVVLFVHAFMSNSKIFIANSFNAKPKDYGHLVAANMSNEQLEDLLGDDPAANSLCLLLLNFGHECWLYDRRGTSASQKHTSQLDETPVINNPTTGEQVNTLTDSALSLLRLVGLDLFKLAPTYNANYWAFSFDEQARDDLPQVIDFVLQQTGRSQLSLVGFSAGGLITLAALSEQVLNQDQLEHVMIWSPGMQLGHGTSSLFIETATMFEPLFANFIGPLGFSSRMVIPSGGSESLSFPEPGHSLICSSFSDIGGGPHGHQNICQLAFFADTFDLASSREFAQIGAAKRKKRMDKFDYLSPSQNQLHYGQSEPPTYNISNIKPLSLSVWQGNSDTTVTSEDAEDLLNKLQFSVEFHLISNQMDGVLFNHFSFVIHKNVSTLLNIPCLKTLEQVRSPK